MSDLKTDKFRGLREHEGPVGMIGLGLLGTALAERLLAGGYAVQVYNRTPDKAGPLIDRGATWSDNPLEECDRVVICLYTTATVEQVLQQMQGGLHEGQVLIDTTTGSPGASAALGARLAKQGVHYLESPIAASSEQTRRGEALAMIGGPQDVVEQNRDVLQCIAPRNFHVGGWGAAAKTKLANNLILGLNRAALAEGLLFAKAIGLDTRTTLEVLQQSNAYSVVMDVKGEKMVSGDFAVQAKLTQHNKDVRLILDEAAAAGLQLPLSALHHQLLNAAEQQGLGELDNCAIIRAIEDWRVG